MRTRARLALSLALVLALLAVPSSARAQAPELVEGEFWPAVRLVHSASSPDPYDDAPMLPADAPGIAWGAGFPCLTSGHWMERWDGQRWVEEPFETVDPVGGRERRLVWLRPTTPWRSGQRYRAGASCQASLNGMDIRTRTTEVLIVPSSTSGPRTPTRVLARIEPPPREETEPEPASAPAWSLSWLQLLSALVIVSLAAATATTPTRQRPRACLR